MVQSNYFTPFLLSVVFLLVSFVWQSYAAKTPSESDLRDSAAHQDIDKGENSDLLTLTSSFSSIIVSEIGDKTFFMAAMMAMKYGKTGVFSGSFGAMIAMTIISAAFGWVLLTILSPTITMGGACVLFLFFGVKLLKDAYDEKDDVNSERFQFLKKKGRSEWIRMMKRKKLRKKSRKSKRN